jgi:hypothetical protein
LELGDFDPVTPAIRKYFADKAGYQTNRFQLAPDRCAEIGRRWQSFLKRYGYDAPPGAPPGAAAETGEGRGGGAVRNVRGPAANVGMASTSPGK